MSLEKDITAIKRLLEQGNPVFKPASKQNLAVRQEQEHARIQKEIAKLRSEGKEVTFGPGTYFLGDIGYVTKDDAYQYMLDNYREDELGVYEYEGKKFAASGTAYGDGRYPGTDGYDYAVDAGLIGIIPKELTDKDGRAQFGNRPSLGRWVKVKKELTFLAHEGIFLVTVDGKEIIIDTLNESLNEAGLVFKPASKEQLGARRQAKHAELANIKVEMKDPQYWFSEWGKTATLLKSELHGTRYKDLVNILGKPEDSYDLMKYDWDADDISVVWLGEINGQPFAIWDYQKDYDSAYSAKFNDFWNISANDTETANKIVDYIEAKLAVYEAKLVFKPASGANIAKRREGKDIKTIFAPYIPGGTHVDIKCPYCENWEEHPKDEQRWHTQSFEYVDTAKEGDKEYTYYVCNECEKEFRIENMFESKLYETKPVFKPATLAQVKHRKSIIPDELQQIADEAGLSPERAQLFKEYVHARWPDVDYGYAEEWAGRFWSNNEWLKSDLEGRRILKRLRPSEYHRDIREAIQPIFKAASPEELTKRGIKPADLEDVKEFLGDDSGVSAEDLNLTTGELSFFKKMQDHLYFGISGGHGSGDWARVYITDLEPADEIGPGVILFKYEYGNDMDRWREWGSGSFNRGNQQVIYDSRIIEAEAPVFKAATPEQVARRMGFHKVPDYEVYDWYEIGEDYGVGGTETLGDRATYVDALSLKAEFERNNPEGKYFIDKWHQDANGAINPVEGWTPAQEQNESINEDQQVFKAASPEQVARRPKEPPKKGPGVSCYGCGRVGVSECPTCYEERRTRKIPVMYKGDREHPGNYDNFTYGKIYNAYNTTEAEAHDNDPDAWLRIINDLGDEVVMPWIDFDYVGEVAEAKRVFKPATQAQAAGRDKPEVKCHNCGATVSDEIEMFVCDYCDETFCPNCAMEYKNGVLCMPCYEDYAQKFESGAKGWKQSGSATGLGTPNSTPTTKG